MRKLIAFLLQSWCCVAFAQVRPERVAGLPTNELYDLHIDRKGYLWIAHGLGISRFDGQNFVSYTHPAQINLRTTDIIEDKHGRIWYHNFSGQVFYIENGKTRLLESYDFKDENQEPRMVLSNNELLITSHKGLFVCNTDNFSTQLLPFQQSFPTALVSIAVVNNKTVVYNNHDWYVYSNRKFQKATLAPPFQLPSENFLSLQPACFSDTLFLTANPSGILYKLKLDGNRLEVVGKTEYHDYINAVSVDKEPWVHTRNQSTNLLNGNSINNVDFNDMVYGNDGSRWYCSRHEGLLVDPRPSLWQQVRFQLNKDDYIRSINASAGYFFTGSKKGNLYSFETDKSASGWTLELFNGFGSIDFIRYINNDLFVVGSSTDTYIVSAKEKKIKTSLPIKAILDVDFDGNSFYVATGMGLYVVPYLKEPIEKKAWLQKKRKQFPSFNWQDSAAAAYLLLSKGTNSVRYDSLNSFVYAATKNGMFEVNRKGAHPYLVGGREVLATAVAFKKTTLYVSTVNDGLWIFGKDGVQHLTTDNLLGSNTISRIKLTEDHLWLFEKDGIQALDIHTGRILQNLDFPRKLGVNVLDVAELGDFGYLTTVEGVYKVPLNLAIKRVAPKGYLDYVIVNGRDTLPGMNARLSYQENDIQFYFSTPVFYDPSSVSFRYRLNGADKEWRVTESGAHTIRYSALPPGDYEFTFYAVDNGNVQQKQVLRFPFSIEKPFWRTWWFFLLANAMLSMVIYTTVKNRINQKLRLELMRRSISNDLHDDIGATLSSVNFYIDLAQSDRQNTEYLRYIKDNVNEVIGSLDDLVWSINPKNDTTGQFINRMKDYAIPLLKAARIQCHFHYDAKLVHLKLDLLTKRHLYLLFKEVVNNVAKHALCRNCTIELVCEQGKLRLVVNDDGQGFNVVEVGRNRNGLYSMQERVRMLKGEIEIRSVTKQGSQVAVTIPL